MAMRKCFATLRRPGKPRLRGRSCRPRAAASLARDACLNVFQVLLGRIERLVSLALAFIGEGRFLQTTRRSPGNSGLSISARSRSSSNNDSCKGPPSAASCWIDGALSAVIQSCPAGLRSNSKRGLADRGLAELSITGAA